MKKTLHIIAVIALFVFATESKAQTLLYYWSFDTLAANLPGPAAGDAMAYLPIVSDSTTMGAPGSINWEAQAGAPAGTAATLWIDNLPADGCTINAQGSAIANAGTAGANSTGLRPRNPSLYAQLVFNVPTTGYQNIMLSFAVESSGSGITNELFDYSTDGGSTYSSTGITVTASTSKIAANEDTVTASWALATVDFSGATAVNNASNLIIRLIYTGAKANTSTSGNDRLDNITIWGTAQVSGISNSSATNAGYSVYPNPSAGGVINLAAPTTGSKTVTVYNTTGQAVYTTTVSGQLSTLAVDNLNAGIYYINVNDNGTNYSLKFAKN